MFENMENLYIAIVLAPLIGAIIAGLFGGVIGRSGAHWVTIIGVGISSILSMLAYKHIVFDGGEVFNQTIYTWLSIGDLDFNVGFLVDELSVSMMVVVTFVSWMIHIYIPSAICMTILVINVSSAIFHYSPLPC